jgi:uncharacterized protein YjcR
MPNGRCRMHGGASTGAPKGNTNALKHGIYSDAIREDERPLWDRIELGGVDDELRLARLQLRRAVKEDKAEIAQKLLGRIAQLEMLRQQLAEKGGSGQAHEAAIEDLA